MMKDCQDCKIKKKLLEAIEDVCASCHQFKDKLNGADLITDAKGNVKTAHPIKAGETFQATPEQIAKMPGKLASPVLPHLICLN